MRGVILSDIHGNLPALEAVSRRIAQVSPDFVYCLGDTVGYNPFPHECIKWVKENCNLVVKGNHDLAIVTRGKEPDGMNPLAISTAIFSYGELGSGELSWLDNLPMFQQMDLLNSTFVHSGIASPYNWEYVLMEDDALYQMSHMKTQFLFIGHSHKPGFWLENRGIWVPADSSQTYRLPARSKHIINVGSVGQPRDRDPRACFAVVDFYRKKLVLNYQRVAYDIQRTVDALGRWGMEGRLTRRLFEGT